MENGHALMEGGGTILLEGLARPNRWSRECWALCLEDQVAICCPDDGGLSRWTRLAWVFWGVRGTVGLPEIMVILRTVISCEWMSIFKSKSFRMRTGRHQVYP